MARRTIVITGASDGIGAAAAKRLSRSGATVVVVGRSPEKTAAVAGPLDADFYVAAFHRGNVASNFSAEAKNPAFALLYRTPLRHIGLIGPERGSDELVWLASAAPGVDWVSGEYYAKHKVSKAHKQASDAGLAERL